LNEKIAAKLEEITSGNLDEQLKLEKELARDYHIITASKRLESIAIDFVEHYSKAWESGKAMFVCIDKLTCVKMFNLIKYHWEEQKKSDRNSIEKSADDQDAIYSSRKLAWMNETKMAVVVSEEQNEEEKFQKWKLSILEHRKLMKEGFQLESGRRMDLETAFKDAFRLSVCNSFVDLIWSEHIRG
jgi:type I restriction enzyme R subunit